ncbi:hypothetical protein ACJZ2D_011663 [Fusarium nematophilum]
MISLYAGTDNKASNATSALSMFLYLALQETFCIPEVQVELCRPLQATIILLHTAPIRFASVGWKHFLLVTLWSGLFVPAVYFFWPETARLPLEEIGKQLGDEIAVHITDATDEERGQLSTGS